MVLHLINVTLTTKTLFDWISQFRQLYYRLYRIGRLLYFRSLNFLDFDIGDLSFGWLFFTADCISHFNDLIKYDAVIFESK